MRIVRRTSNQRVHGHDRHAPRVDLCTVFGRIAFPSKTRHGAQPVRACVSLVRNSLSWRWGVWSPYRGCRIDIWQSFDHPPSLMFGCDFPSFLTKNRIWGNVSGIKCASRRPTQSSGENEFVLQSIQGHCHRFVQSVSPLSRALLLTSTHWC